MNANEIPAIEEGQQQLPSTPQTAIDPTLRHYRKELVKVPWAVNGALVPFEYLDGNRGVIRISPSGPPMISSADNKGLIAALDKAADTRRGGIVRISFEEYEALKKKHPHNPAADAQKETLRMMPRGPLDEKPSRTQPPQAAAVVAAGKIPTDIPGIPLRLIGEQQEFKPTTARLSDLRSKAKAQSKPETK